MFAGFRTPTLIQRKNIQQENDVSARKRGQLSARKPFSERSNININKEKTPIINKPIVINKPVKNEPEPEPEIDITMCMLTYKDINDNFVDIVNNNNFLNGRGLRNIFSNFLDNEPPPPPPLEDTFVELIEVSRDCDELLHEDLCGILNNDFENVNFDIDVPIPELNFDF